MVGIGDERLTLIINEISVTNMGKGWGKSSSGKRNMCLGRDGKATRRSRKKGQSSGGKRNPSFYVGPSMYGHRDILYCTQG